MPCLTPADFSEDMTFSDGDFGRGAPNIVGNDKAHVDNIIKGVSQIKLKRAFRARGADTIVKNKKV